MPNPSASAAVPVRAGADLGFRMTVVRDAVLGFDLSGLPARTIFDVTMAHLEADFATVLDTSAIIQSEQVTS